MDLGATLCSRKPACGPCPLRDGCVAYNESRAALPKPVRKILKNLPGS
jgi:A/G-specific adenine glycosylase